MMQLLLETLKLPELEEMLKKAGYQPEGYETMMSGFTGKMFQMRTFICPVRYQKIKTFSPRIKSIALADHMMFYFKRMETNINNYIEDEVALFEETEMNSYMNTQQKYLLILIMKTYVLH